MTDHEQERFEAQLRQLKPGKLPEDVVARIQSSICPPPSPSPKFSPQPSLGFHRILRWLIPATAAILFTAVIWQRQQDSTVREIPSITSENATAAARPRLKADNVQIGKELVSSFDAVATLPGGEPVRFRCQQWVNRVVVDDEKQGLLVESRMPRVVVVPVGFETY